MIGLLSDTTRTKLTPGQSYTVKTQLGFILQGIALGPGWTYGKYTYDTLPNEVSSKRVYEDTIPVRKPVGKARWAFAVQVEDKWLPCLPLEVFA